MNMRRARGEFLAKAGVVQRGHHRFSSAGRGDEQVAMVPKASGQCDLLEETLLERLRPQLDRAHREPRSTNSFGVGPREELLAIVRNEVTAVPVALEDGGDLVDDARIAGARHAKVPLETANLRRVRQIRRADIGRRKARTPVEEPRLRMESGAGLVVGHPNVGAELTKFIEGLRFG
jgi:hypothetical protein